jgi:hypothetical protein
VRVKRGLAATQADARPLAKSNRNVQALRALDPPGLLRFRRQLIPGSRPDSRQFHPNGEKTRQGPQDTLSGKANHDVTNLTTEP